MVCSDKRLKYFFNELELKEVLREESPQATQATNTFNVARSFEFIANLIANSNKCLAKISQSNCQINKVQDLSVN